MPRKPMGKVAMTSTERSRQRPARLRRGKLFAPKLEKQRIKRERRASRELELATATARASTLLGNKLYAVISCEPSEKPDVFTEMIEAYFPNVPKLEMFARRARSGWDVWGNEVVALPLRPSLKANLK
jgi:hypothetical protein